MSDFSVYFSGSLDLVFSLVGEGLIVKARPCVVGDVMDGYLEALQATSLLNREELRGGDQVYVATQSRLWYVKILKRGG